MAIVINNSNTWVNGASYLGWQNYADDLGSIVTATNSDPGFTIANAVSWPTYEKFKTTTNAPFYIFLSMATSRTINSFGLARHNLGSENVSCRLEYSTDSGVTWNILADTTRTTSYRNETVYAVASAGVSARLWRIYFYNIPAFKNTTFYIGNIFFGNSLKLFGPPEAGFTPPDLALKNEFISNESDGGDFLGRTLLRKAAETGFTMSNVPASWVSATWPDVMQALSLHPFYFSWDSINYPYSVGYCYVEREIDAPSYSSAGFYNVSLKFRAIS